MSSPIALGGVPACRCVRVLGLALGPQAQRGREFGWSASNAHVSEPASGHLHSELCAKEDTPLHLSSSRQTGLSQFAVGAAHKRNPCSSANCWAWGSCPMLGFGSRQHICERCHTIGRLVRLCEAQRHRAGKHLFAEQIVEPQSGAGKFGGGAHLLQQQPQTAMPGPW